MNKNAAKTSNSQIIKESIEDKLYYKIREEIQNGTLPQGTQLVQDNLAIKFGVSRIPVRSVLQLLEKDRLIHRTNKKGSFIVTEYRNSDITEMIELSKLIKLKIVAEAFPGFNDLVIKQLEKINQKIRKSSLASFQKLNDDFHYALFSYTNKKLFKRFATDLRETRPMFISVKDTDGIIKASDEHELLIEHIRSKDLDGFSKLYNQHINW